MRIGLFVHGIAAFSLLTVISSCGKDKDDANSLTSTKSVVALNDTVTPDGCMSVPLYNQQLRLLNPGLTALQATTKMSFSSKNGVRHNYEILSSLGGFQYGDVSIFKLQQIQNVAQSACESFTITDADGAQKVYKVKDKAREFITGETEAGERLTYRWLSPTQMEITTRFISYDVPCGSENTKIFVDQTKVYDWSGAIPAQVTAADSPIGVDRALLERIAEATGKPVTEFYATDSDGVELTDQLRNVPNLTPRPELLACGVVTPPPHDGDNNGDNGGNNNGGDTGNGGDNGDHHDDGGGSGDNGGGDTPPPPTTPHGGVGAS